MPIVDPPKPVPHIHFIRHVAHSPFFAAIIASLIRLDVFNKSPTVNSAVASIKMQVKQFDEYFK
jgi:hypothetical protein